jgi:uncharacterized membrane protein
VEVALKFLILLVLAGVVAYLAPAPVAHRESSIEINAKTEDVWAIVSDLGGVRRWDPAVREAHVVTTTSEGRGAVRRFEGAFVKTTEKVTEWERPHKITFAVSHEPDVTRYETSTLRILPAGAGSKVVWTLDYQMKGGYLGVLLDRVFVSGVISGRLEPALSNLKHLAETGETTTI